MWEITLKANKNHAYMLDYINEKLNLEFENEIVVGQYYGRQTCFLSIATKNENNSKVYERLKRHLCTVFCEQFKHEFIESHLSCINSNNPYFNLFVKLYTYFDLELENSIAFRLIECKRCVVLESYFNFKLAPLKKKWNELCNIINNNSQVIEDENFLSLLKFLIENLEQKTDCVVLSLIDGCVVYEDEKTKQKIWSALPEKQMDIVCKIIEMAPKKIVVYANSNSGAILNILKTLFDSKLQILSYNSQ